MKFGKVYLTPTKWEYRPDMGVINPREDLEYVNWPPLEVGMERIFSHTEIKEWPEEPEERRIAAEGHFLKIEETLQKRFGVSTDTVNVIRTAKPPLHFGGITFYVLLFYVDIRLKFNR